MTESEASPALRDLLRGLPSNWGRWGADDEVGALNFLGATEVLAGVAAVRQGRTFTLQTPVGHPHGDPVWPGRRGMERYMVVDEASWLNGDKDEPPGGMHWADDMISGYLQGTTQFDALGHVWYDERIYNGRPAVSTVGGLRFASVAPIARRGVVGRAVLLDIARHRGVPHLERGETFGLPDLLAAADAQGVELRPRDIVMLRTGWLETWYDTTADEFYRDFREPGLTFSADLVEWFHTREIPCLVTDTMGNETTLDPEIGAQLPLHNALMRNLGVVFCEACDLGPLAADCAADGQWDFLFTAAPLNILEAAGAPANPVVIK
ncbi:cyclase family protein [Salinibacterium sp. ZJ77]|uniref:cyclase family protein n=1 Tax=Salinibacterium sp. ZJ77 TaxID=2708337 RepID=UPI00141F427D|nr:cyclase family protein [Salinibacterium sp. ZJ77]